MSKRSARPLIDDILESINKISNYTAGMVILLTTLLPMRNGRKAKMGNTKKYSNPEP